MKNLKINVPDGYEIDKENSTFEEIVFKKVEKSLPKSWLEAIERKKYNGFYVSGSSGINKCVIEDITDLSTFPTEEEAEACLALSQLCVLRDVYNEELLDDWADWTDYNQDKFCVNFYEDKIDKCCFNVTREVLTFKTKELRDEFLENFKDLIIKAKPLL